MKDFEKSLQQGLANLNSFRKNSVYAETTFTSVPRLQSPLGMKPKSAAVFFGASVIPIMFSRKRKLELLLLGGLICGGLALLRKTPHTLSIPFSWNEFEKLLRAYLNNNQIENLLEITENTDFEPIESEDLTLYGLPNFLICESDEIAQMLRANQFHLQTPCGVLSLKEANPLAKSIIRMMNNAENAPVFYLHDADGNSFAMLKNLREMLGLGERISLRILGLRPVHAKRLHLFSQRKDAEFYDLEEITFLEKAEIDWLQNGNFTEVAAVSPIRLMRVLRRLILFPENSGNERYVSLPKKNLGFM